MTEPPKRVQRKRWFDKENDELRVVEKLKDGKSAERAVHHLTMNKFLVKKQTSVGVAQKKLKLLKQQPAKEEVKCSRIPMPFVQKSNLYDEHWTFKQERGFTKWLNHILTPHDEHGRCIAHDGKIVSADGLRICMDATHIDSSYLDMKQPSSSNQLSITAYRELYRQRKAACLLYQSEPLMLVIPRLEAEIESQRLCMRPEKCPHADVGIKQDIIQTLVLSYHPLWLRLGLEVVFGELIQIKAGEDITHVLRSFISERLFSNSQITDFYLHPVTSHSFRVGYTSAVSQYIVKRFLLLVLFLDHAKLTRLIDYDPCLFQVTSSIKSSRDMLQIFSSKYLSGEGDIIKHLQYLGFTVTQTQAPLDEFDFTVTNLALDLRDGLRLVRLVEALTSNWKLSKQLRFPVSTKMQVRKNPESLDCLYKGRQKVHNIQVALKALEQHIPIPAGVTPDSIAEGHKEKTLALLWSIIFHFKVKLLLSESNLREEIAYLKKQRQLYGVDEADDQQLSPEPDMFFEPTLNLLLQWCKAVCKLYGVPVNNFNSSFSDGRVLCYLIHHYHPQLLTLDLIKDATTITQSSEPKCIELASLSENGAWSATFSPTMGYNKCEDELLENEKFNFKLVAKTMSELGGMPSLLQWKDMSNTLPNEKVVIAYVSYLCHQLFVLRKEIRAARCIQYAWWKYKQQKTACYQTDIRYKAVIIIQAWVKGYFARRAYKKKHLAAVALQQWWRSIHLMQEQCKIFRRKKWAVATLQKAYRLWKASKAITTITAAVRGYLVCKRYKHMRNAALRIQKIWRERKRKRNKAASIIQAAVRNYLIRRQCLKKEKAVLVIQRAYKRHIARCQHAAATIQRWYHSIIKSRHSRAEFLTRKAACVKIQHAFRAYCQQRQFIHSVLVIQRAYRVKMQQVWYLRMLNASITIQRHYRGYHVRAHLANQHSAATVLQAYIRRYLAQRFYSTAKHSVLLIQSIFRMHLAIKQYTIIRSSVIKIQAYMRMFLAWRHYCELRNSVVILQSYIRCKFQMKQYKMTKSSIVRLQALIRRHLAQLHYSHVCGAVKTLQSYIKMFIIRRQYLQCREAAIMIQSYTRRFIARKKYINVIWAAVVIQSYFRGYLQRCTYCRIKVSTLVLQKHARGMISRKHYHQTKQFIVKLQTLIRGYLVRSRLQEQEEAAIVIQSYMRRFLAMKHYCKLKKTITGLQALVRGYIIRRKGVLFSRAAIIIQSCFRGYLARSLYLKQRRSVIILQAHLRSFIVQKQYQQTRLQLIKAQAVVRGYILRQNYNKMKMAAIVLQSHIRQFYCRKHYLKQKATLILLQAYIHGYLLRRNLILHKKATEIQSYYRGYLARKQYKMLKNSTVILQTKFRSCLERRRYIIARQSIIKVQAFIRGYYVRSRQRELKVAAITLQSQVRRYLAVKHYCILRNSVVQLQSHARGYIARKYFTALKKNKAAVTIQSLVRGYLVRQHHMYKQKRQSAIFIQASFRSYDARRRFLTTKKSIIKVQAIIRSHLARSHYLKAQKAAVKLQSLVRCFLAQRSYKDRKKAVIAIQAAFRSFLAWRQYRKDLNSIIVVQSYVRMFLARLHYKQEVISVITVQACCRQYLAYKAYLKARQSVIKIQAFFRGYIVRAAFKRYKESCLVTQIPNTSKEAVEFSISQKHLTSACWKLQSQDKVKLCSVLTGDIQKAATVIQAAWRGWYVRKHQNSLQVKKLLVKVSIANSTANESNKLKNSLPHLLQQLMSCKYLSTAVELLKRLVNITEVSETCSQVVVKYSTIPVLLNFITSTNRSAASLQLITVVLNILINICKWPSTACSVFEDKNTASILVDFMVKVHLSHHDNVNLTCQLLNHYLSCKAHTKRSLTEADWRKINLVRETLERKSKLGRSGKLHGMYANSLRSVKSVLEISGQH